MSNLALLANAAVAVAIIIGYAVLVALGHDGDPLLGLLGGQGIAALIGKAADAKAPSA